MRAPRGLPFSAAWLPGPPVPLSKGPASAVRSGGSDSPGAMNSSPVAGRPESHASSAILADAATVAGPQRGIPSLDGLRAFSILFVIASHLILLPGAARLPEPFAAFGNFGVRVFFVISGFLITSLLVREKDEAGSIDLRRFWYRRAMRIFPPYFVFLAAVALFMSSGVLPQADVRWWPALTYTSNYFHVGAWFIAHSWSLSVEEQFYLCWPLVIAFASRRTALRVALTVIALAPFIRVGIFVATRDYDAAQNWDFDFIAAGCALALAAPTLARSELWIALNRAPRLVAACLAVVFLHLAFSHSHRWVFVVEILAELTIEAVVIAAALAWCVQRPDTLVGRLLNAPPVRWIGLISYSLYLWQQVFFRPSGTLTPVQAAAATLLVSMLSYYLIERPALRARGRLERWWTSRHSVVAETKLTSPE